MLLLFLFYLQSLLLTLVQAKVGFEFELGQFHISYAEDPSKPIPRKTLLFQAPSNLWNLTVDELDQVGNDLEVITEPVEFYSGKHYISQMQNLKAVEKMGVEIRGFISSLIEASSATSRKISVFTIPAISTEKYRLEFHPNPKSGDIAVAPQVTFGILPSHFYHLACEYLFMKEEDIDDEFRMYFSIPEIKSMLIPQCVRLKSFFDLQDFQKIPQSRNPVLLSFLTLFHQYVVVKTNDCLKYPKLVTGVFLSRISFAELFHSLPVEIKVAILENDLLHRIVEIERGNGYSQESKQLYPFGYQHCNENNQIEFRVGPTIESWIQGFTRNDNPIDMLADLDEDGSMGKMSLDDVFCGNLGCAKLWIIEHRGLAMLRNKDIPDAVNGVYTFLSEFNTKIIPGLDTSFSPQPKQQGTQQSRLRFH